MTETIEATSPPPRWRRIVDFPLVAMLIAIVALIAVGTVFTLLQQFVFPKDPSVFGKTWRAALALAMLIAVFQFTNRRLGETRRNDLPRRAAPRDIGMGVVAGTLLYSAVIGIAAVIGIYRVLGLGTTSDLIPALVGSAIAPAITEELLFRGVLQRWLEEFGGTAFGLIASAILFALGHAMNPGVTPLAIGVIVLAGLWLGTAYKLSGSLWLPIGLHGAWNFAQGEIWDVPVSGHPANGLLEAELKGPQMLTGGPFGLEASVLALVVLVLVAGWQTSLVYRRGATMPHWWARRRLAGTVRTGTV